MICAQRRQVAASFAYMASKVTRNLGLRVRRMHIKILQGVLEQRKHNLEQARQQNKCAVAIQGMIRRKIAHRDLREKKEEKRRLNAAIRIQMWVRFLLAHREIHHRRALRVREEAWKVTRKDRLIARRLQRCSKHARSPKHHMFVKPELRLKKLYGKKGEASSTLIQRVVRRRIQKTHAATKIQSLLRGNRVRSLQLQRFDAATRVQCVIRGILVRKKMVGSDDDNDNDDDDDDHNVENSRESMLSLLDEVEEVKQNVIKQNKRIGTSAARGTFFGTYRRSDGGGLYLKNHCNRGDSISEDEAC